MLFLPRDWEALVSLTEEVPLRYEIVEANYLVEKATKEH